MTDIDAAGAAGAEASLGLSTGKRVQAVGHFEPSLELVRIPACPSCGAANPRGADACESCGAMAPPKTDYRKVRPVLTAGAFPWHARALLWIAAQLMRLGKWLQRS
jgi:ribosomal protein L40E